MAENQPKGTYLTLQETMVFTGLSEAEIVALVESGQLTPHRLPKVYRLIRRYRLGVRP